MEYFLSCVDNSGYTYSIDNVILEYTIKYKYDMISYLQELSNKYDNQEEYWEKLNTPYSSRYQFYNNHIHLRNGIYLMIGKYDTYSDLSGTHDIFPIIKLEINPNKHAKKPIFTELIKYLKDNAGDCSLKRYDFCIDIMCKLQDIEVFGSRKEKGLYKGTRYYGQRNHDGYLKIYDKRKEQELDYDLTRIEYTLQHEKGKKKKQGLNIEAVYISDQQEDNITNINSTYQVICKLYNLCKVNNIDSDEVIEQLDKRAKRQVLEGISGYKYKKIEVDIALHDSLLKKIKDIFGVVEHKLIIEDKDGFLTSTNGFDDLPFD